MKGSLDVDSKLKVKFRMKDFDLKESSTRLGKMDEDDNEMFKCDCGSACEVRIHMVEECTLHEKERKIYTSELGEIESCDRNRCILELRKEVDCGSRNRIRLEKVRVEVNRFGEIFAPPPDKYE